MVQRPQMLIKRLSWLKENNVKIVPFTSDQFPHNLKQIYDPPLVLYIKGDILKSDTLALAIVGRTQVQLLWPDSGGKICNTVGSGRFLCRKRYGKRY